MPRLPRLCEHVLVNGSCCGALALKDSEFCYWHHAARVRRQARVRDANPHFALPVLEDANSIMITIEQVIHGILDGRIEPRVSGQLLYALQTAAMLVPELRLSGYHKHRFMHQVPVDGDDPALPASNRIDRNAQPLPLPSRSLQASSANPAAGVAFPADTPTPKPPRPVPQDGSPSLRLTS